MFVLLYRRGITTGKPLSISSLLQHPRRYLNSDTNPWAVVNKSPAKHAFTLHWKYLFIRLHTSWTNFFEQKTRSICQSRIDSHTQKFLTWCTISLNLPTQLTDQTSFSPFLCEPETKWIRTRSSTNSINRNEERGRRNGKNALGVKERELPPHSSLRVRRKESEILKEENIYFGAIITPLLVTILWNKCDLRSSSYWVCLITRT